MNMAGIRIRDIYATGVHVFRTRHFKINEQFLITIISVKTQFEIKIKG